LENGLVRKVCLFFLVPLFFHGCVSTHYDRSENFQFSWKIGDFKSAAIEAENLSQNGSKRDRLLYKLEEGSVKRLAGDLDGSVMALEEASAEYDRWFGVHLKTEARVSEAFSSVVGSAEWKPYKSRVYERVMMRVYQALNYLQLDEKGRARAEIFKSRQAIEDSKEIWKKELIVAQSNMKKKGVDLDQGINAEGKNLLRDERLRIRAMVPSNLPEYVNPAAIYLESLYFLRTGSQREDFDKAAFSLRQLASLFPQNKWIQDDFSDAKKGIRSPESITYVFFETGRAPVRVEKRFDLPIVFFANQARIPYLGIALPSLKTNDQFLSGLRINTNTLAQPVQTKVLADMDAIVAKEFDKDYPIELSRAISGAFVKGGLQYLATDSVRSENDTARAIVGIGIGLLAQATTKADLRAWGTLPKQIQFCKIKTPEDKKLTLRGVGATLSKEVALNPSSSTNLVWVRSVSAHTPIRVVGVLSLDP
jgi:uncharacterized protein